MRTGPASWALLLALPATVWSAAAPAREPAGLHQALDSLAKQGKFSGAVVVYEGEEVRFARAYGAADPFTKRAFTPDTPVDSGSLAKPVTAAAVLMLAREGRIELDVPVRRYLSDYPHTGTTVRHLLAHSAGLPLEETPEALAGKTNSALLKEAANRAPLFDPGTAFAYCNLCYATLALLIERVSGTPYLAFVHRRASLPEGVTLRPQRLADWRGRAIGYRRSTDDKVERFDSWEGEAFYGAANFSLSARQLAQWGVRWSSAALSPIRAAATAPAFIAGEPSGLSQGSWYCAPDRRRCHYVGHHEGFHHMLYWDANRRLSVAMVTNNTLAPAMHQALQRALVLFAEDRPVAAREALKTELPSFEAPVGKITTRAGEKIEVERSGDRMSVKRRGVSYPAYPTGSPIRYVPGLDAYIAKDEHGRMHWITLHDHAVGDRVRRGR